MGDAAIGMVGMDIETAARNRIGILTVVFNNGAMASERGSMPEAAEKHCTWAATTETWRGLSAPGQARGGTRRLPAGVQRGG